MTKAEARLLKEIEARITKQRNQLIFLKKGSGKPKVEVQHILGYGLVLKVDDLLRYYQTDGALNELLYIKDIVERNSGREK